MIGLVALLLLVRPAPLGTAAAVRELPNAEADRGRPADLTGVVTQVTPNRMELFVQDRTCGVCVRVNWLLEPAVRRGLRVRVIGHTEGGWFAPIVIGHAVQVLGDDRPPDPLPFDLSATDSRWLDGQYVQTHCLVREARPAADPPALVVEGTGGVGELEFLNPIPEAELRAFVGAVVRVRGICVPVFDANRRATGAARIGISATADVEVVQTADRVSATPVRTAAHLRQYVPGTSPIPLVRTTGVVVAHVPPAALVVQDDTGGYSVRPRTGAVDAFPPGTQVSVTGFLTWSGERISVGSADVTADGSAPLPPPRELATGDEALAADGCRVRFRGRVTDARPGRLTLASGGLTVAVRVPDGWGDVAEEGATVTVTGALTSRFDLNTGLVLLPLVPADVVTDVPADHPLFTPTQAAGVGGGLVVLLVAAGGWVAALRSAVRARTRQLAESERKFATAFRASPDAIIITHAPDGRFVDVNDRYLHMLGLPREQVVGRTSVELGWVDPVERGRMMDEIRRNGEVRDFAARMKGQGGEVRDVQFSSAPITLGGAACLLGVIRDVTDDRKRRAAVEASERKFAALFRLSPVGMLLSRLADGRILEVNRGFEQMMRQPAAAVVGRTSVEAGLLTPYERERLVAEVQAAGRLAETEYHVTRADGTHAVHLSSAEVVQIGGEQLLILCMLDVTDSYRQRAAVTASEKKFAALFESSPVAITVARADDGALIDVNRAFTLFYGYPKEACVGRTPAEIGLYPEPAAGDRMQPRLSADGFVYDYEMDLRRQDGTVATVVGNTELVQVDRDEWVISCIIDVTARRKAERALERSERQFAAIFRLSPVAIAVSRADDGTLIDVNQGFEELYRVSRARALSTPVADLGIYPDPAVRDHMFAELKRLGRLRDIELSARRTDGIPVDVVGSAELMRVDGVDYVISCAIDVTARRAAERARAESERKFTQLFAASPHAIVISRIDDGTLLEVNPAFCQLLGYTREELVGQSAVDLGLWDAVEDRQAIRRELEETGRVAVRDTALRTRDGQVRHTLMSIEMIELDGRRVALGSAQDITARRRAEQALEASERKFARLFDASPNAIAISQLEDGILLEVNPAFCQLVGYARDEVIGRPGPAIGFWDDPAEREVLRRELEAAGRLAARDVVMRTKGGEERHTLLSAELIDLDGRRLILGTAQDITARRRAERARAESERKAAAVFRLSPVSLALSRVDGTIVEVNQAFEKTYRLRREQVIGRHAGEFSELYSSPAERDDWAVRLRAAGRLDGIEARRVLSDGTAIDIVVSAEWVELDGTSHALVAVTDVTPLKRAEAALREANATLERRVVERTEELAAANTELEAFCYSVSHDLRAPLRSIDGFTQAVLEDYGDALDADGKQYLHRVRAAARRLSELIDDLLTLSRVTRADMHRQVVDLSALGAEVVAELRTNDRERQVEVLIAPGLTAHGDRALLRVVLDNLLGNAWKYTGRTPSPRIEFGREPGPNGEIYFVRDNGAGFDPNYAHKLFQPFQRLHRADEFPGHGVGLATVLRVLRRHGGAVTAESSIGTGATFRFTIPHRTDTRDA